MATAKTEEKKIEEFSWDDMREVFVPKDTSDGRKSTWVCVNGREFCVPRGKKVTVPYPIAERLEIMMAAAERADEEADQVPNRG